MHHSVYRLLLKLLVPVLLVSAQAQAGAVKQLIIGPNNDKHGGWVELINSAQKSVHLAMYNLSQPEVIEALKAAAQRRALEGKGNVDVQVLFDRNNGAKEDRAKIIADMQAAGVKVQLSSPGFTISHQKSMAIDGEKILISTINLTRHSDTTRGYGVVLTNKGIIKEFINVFEQDIQNGKDGTAITPPVKQEALVWSPHLGVEKLINLIKSAQSTIELEVENLSYEPIINALMEAQETRNVAVRVITPLCDFNSNPFFNIPALKTMAAKGVGTKVMGIPNTATEPYIHAKMIRVDGKQLYLGSLNFTYNSLESAREVGVIIKDKAAINTIGAEFEKDWSRAQEVPADTSKIECPKF